MALGREASFVRRGEPLTPGIEMQGAGAEGEEIRQIAKMLHENQSAIPDEHSPNLLKQCSSVVGGSDLVRDKNKERDVDALLGQW